MKTFLILFYSFIFVGIASAEVYVVYNTSTKEVLSVSPSDDAVVDSQHTKEILPGDISDYPLEYAVQDYKFERKRFVANTKKISDREKSVSDMQALNNELALIDKQARKAAYEQLKADGVKFVHVNDSTFE